MVVLLQIEAAAVVQVGLSPAAILRYKETQLTQLPLVQAVAILHLLAV
jgi:hypothetical protein